ncbi:MAG: YgiQ family radical SAM protein [Clostridia bacterium]|nr:YgiQ family radical SAM protein [Clostridia bacterium]
MKQSCHTALPMMTRAEFRNTGLDALDFVLVSGDAYIDHPSFGAAIIARLLMDAGYTVGVIPQPDWHSVEAFRIFGRPRLAYLVTGGNIDSMVNHYTVMKRRRSEDAYTPGGKAGARPDRATIVYGNKCKEAYRDVPVILGGIEASLRRFAHYDYWDNRVRHSILYDACGDLLVYGMGEKTILEIARLLNKGVPVSSLTAIPGTCYRANSIDHLEKAVILPSYQQVSSDKKAYADAFMLEEREHDAIRGRVLVQAHEKGYLVVNPPMAPLTTEELDRVYELPYTRRPHPIYKDKIPALDEVSFSIASTRGCYGGCSFCALTFHQGRVIQARSHDSIIREAKLLSHDRDFKGYIHDVGGPTANFRQPACEKQTRCGVCPDRQCIGFEPCKNLVVDHQDYTVLLKKLRQLPGIKKVFVRSGIRYDYLIYDKNRAFLEELAEHHVSGQLKVAPEHVSDRVLYYMNKPRQAIFDRFVQAYEACNRKKGKEQYLVPYLISSHPGSELSDAIELASYLKKNHMRPEQVQDFYPTPGTLSTAMFYTGLDPRTGKRVYIPRDPEEKRMQRALIQYYEPRNFSLVRRALKKADREDLIGFHKEALAPPERTEKSRDFGARKRKNSVDKPRRNR